MAEFQDTENTLPGNWEPSTLLGADQLPEEEQMQDADSGLASVIEQEVNSEAGEGVVTNHLVDTVNTRFQAALRNRDSDEGRWLQAYQNYRGLYAKNIKFTEHEKSRVFVKVTKTKVLAAYGQLIDVLFGANKFPISIRPTKVPEGTAELVHWKQDGAPGIENGMPMDALSIPEPEIEINPFDVGYEGDGIEVMPGAKQTDVSEGIKQELLKNNKQNFQEGPGYNGEPELKPAAEAAMRMEKLIHDQIEESNGAQELRDSLFEACLLGTGIIKGPFTYKKTLHRWELDEATGNRIYKPEIVKVPRIAHTSIWNAFPDPNATTIDECEWFIERHKMGKSELRALKNRPFFNKQAIENVLNTSPNYVRQDYENQLLAENNSVFPEENRYEVLEYWGLMDKSELEPYQLSGLEGVDDIEEVQVNVWVCAGQLLRVVINPFTPKRIPYLSFHYERNPYTFFGVGVAENMSDAQMIMNGHMRMAIDNLALAGHMVFDVDETALVSGQNMEIYPGKVFKRNGGQPGQAVYGIKFNSTANENMQIFDKFRQIADESTGIPSYAHGQTGVMSTTRTAAGMSMLMGAASLNVKTVVGNVDDFLLKPLGESYFQWNMAFYEGDLEIVGDLEVKAGGTASLMQNEIKSQRLTAFGQLFQNPAVAPWIKIPAWLKAFVESLELDADEFINDPDEAAIMAAQIGSAGGLAMGMPGIPGTGQGEVGGVPAPAMPGDQAFSGTEQPTAPETEGNA